MVTDAAAADVSVDSDMEAARFTAKGLSRDFNLLLDVLSDELRNPSFPEEQISRLKAQTVAGLEMQKEDPQAIAYRQFSRMIYPEGHPYCPLTVEEDQIAVKALTRDNLVDFHKKFFGPETTIIAISGDVKTDEAVAAIEKYFGDWQPVGPARKIEIPKVPLATQPSQVVITMSDKAQVNVMCGHAGQLRRTDPDYYAATVMNEVLGGGGGLDSKLGLRIREHMGLVYSVWSTFDAGIGDGPWISGFGSNPANVDKALKAMDEVVRDYIKNGPTQKEFKDAVDYLIGVFPIRLETNDGVAGILAAEEFYDLGMDYIQRHTAIYEAITMDQVREAAKKYLHPDKRTLVIVGDYKGDQAPTKN
jgi:zinc protease